MILYTHGAKYRHEIVIWNVGDPGPRMTSCNKIEVREDLDWSNRPRKIVLTQYRRMRLQGFTPDGARQAVVSLLCVGMFDASPIGKSITRACERCELMLFALLEMIPTSSGRERQEIYDRVLQFFPVEVQS